MWVFGYGSILWKQNFPFAEVQSGTLRGYVRRFYQLSPDHRGTPEQSGRTVTLVPEDGGVTWGLAFKIPEESVEETIEYLNMREQAGYERVQVDFHPDDGSPSFPLHVYISINDPDNIYYNPTSTIEEIVETIMNSQGESGHNLEYALRIAHIHRRLAPHIPDPHLFSIESRLLKLCKEKQKAFASILQLVRRDPEILVTG